MEDMFDWGTAKFGLENWPKMWIVGGWAVDVYNPWFGSRDIDIMAKSKVVSELKRYLYSERSYKKYKGPDGVMRFYKEVGREQIEIDFIKSKQSFQGTDDIMSVEISPENSENLHLKRNKIIIVPNRSILLGMKIKAVWDRNYMLKAGKYYNHSYVEDKISKDYGDIIALLDDKYIRNKPLNLQYLHDEILSKDYLKKLLKSLTPHDFQGFNYRSLDPDDCKELIDRLLSIA